VPINWYWQQLLEALFPSSVPVADSTKSEKPKEPKMQFSVVNTLLKFLADQTLGAAFNIPLFLATVGLAKGQSTDQIVSAIQRVSTFVYIGVN
jgi:protein Mpv17